MQSARQMRSRMKIQRVRAEEINKRERENERKRENL